jgi:hypothetical protein
VYHTLRSYSLLTSSIPHKYPVPPKDNLIVRQSVCRFSVTLTSINILFLWNNLSVACYVYLLLTTLAEVLVMSSQTYTEPWSGDVIANTHSSSKDNLIVNQSVDGTYCSNTHTSPLTLPYAILFFFLIYTPSYPHPIILTSILLLFYFTPSFPTPQHFISTTHS